MKSWDQQDRKALSLWEKLPEEEQKALLDEYNNQTWHITGGYVIKFDTTGKEKPCVVSVFFGMELDSETYVYYWPEPRKKLITSKVLREAEKEFHEKISQMFEGFRMAVYDYETHDQKEELKTQAYALHRAYNIRKQIEGMMETQYNEVQDQQFPHDICPWITLREMEDDGKGKATKV